MKKLLSALKIIKNNWKKSTFALAVISYGGQYAKNSYDNNQLMREYCLLASKYGDAVNPVIKPFRNITVVLNPAANKRSSKDLYEKYCAPLLHLAGLAVSVIYTEYAGQAKDIADSIDPNTDALVIAGGDGTLSEIITGLLRRLQGNRNALKKLPLGILPLGRSNSISRALLGNKDEIRALADSTMAIIDGSLKTVDVMKIESIDDENNSKPVYSLVHVEWGCFRNAKANRDKFWYFGKFRDYVSYLFTKIGESVWECSYTEPCKGCNKCIQKPQDTKRWWNFFIPNTTKAEIDYSNIINEDCGKFIKTQLSTIEIAVKTTTVTDNSASDAPHLVMTVTPGVVNWTNFVSEGWRRLSGKKSEPLVKTIVKDLHLIPLSQNEDDWLSIDNENFEVKPLKISIVPKAVNIFQPKINGFI